MIERLKEINQLRDNGEITKEEADDMKADLVRSEIKDGEIDRKESKEICIS